MTILRIKLVLLWHRYRCWKGWCEGPVFWDDEDPTPKLMCVYCGRVWRDGEL